MYKTKVKLHTSNSCALPLLAMPLAFTRQDPIPTGNKKVDAFLRGIKDKNLMTVLEGFVVSADENKNALVRVLLDSGYARRDADSVVSAVRTVLTGHLKMESLGLLFLNAKYIPLLQNSARVVFNGAAPAKPVPSAPAPAYSPPPSEAPHHFTPPPSSSSSSSHPVVSPAAVSIRVPSIPHKWQPFKTAQSDTKGRFDATLGDEDDELSEALHTDMEREQLHVLLGIGTRPATASDSVSKRYNRLRAQLGVILLAQEKGVSIPERLRASVRV
jgi:hypothetical protein